MSNLAPSQCVICYKPLGHRLRYCSDACAEIAKRDAARDRYEVNRDAVLAKRRDEYAAAKAATDAYMRSVKATPGADPQQVADAAARLIDPQR